MHVESDADVTTCTIELTLVRGSSAQPFNGSARVAHGTAQERLTACIDALSERLVATEVDRELRRPRAVAPGSSVPPRP